MRSLVFTTIFPNPSRPTHGVFVERRTKALSDYIQTCIVAPISYIHQYRDLRKIPSKLLFDQYSILYPRYFSIPKFYKELDGKLLYSFTKKCVKQAIKDHSPDFIDASYAYPDGYAAMMHAHEARLPYFLTVRGSDLYLLAEDAKRKPLIQEALCSAAGVIAVSQGLADKVLGMGVDCNKITVIENGVDRELFRSDMAKGHELKKRLGIPDDAIVLLCVGRLVALKRFALLIEALQVLKNEKHKRSFFGVIVGSGPEKSKLERLAEECGVINNIYFAGQVKPEELSGWYTLADQLMVLSTHEGSPNVPLEALSCGTPVIATKVGNLPALIDARNGQLLDSPTPVKLAMLIQTMGRADQVKRALVCASVSHLSWESVAIQQYEFYKQSLENN